MTQALHQASHRRDKPLHTINRAALPWPVLDLQLFGEDGQSGLFAEAKGGTLPRRDRRSVGVTPGQVAPGAGGIWSGYPEVRVISSSHQDLVTAMEEGRFREDLFYRLNVANITLPPLSARSGTSPAGPSGAGRLPQPSPRLRRPRLLAGGAGPAGRRQPGGQRAPALRVVEQLASLCCSPVIGAAMVESALSGGGGGIPSFNGRGPSSRRVSDPAAAPRRERDPGGQHGGRNRTDFYKLLNRHGIGQALQVRIGIK